MTLLRLVTLGTEEALGDWVPPRLLAAALLAVLGGTIGIFWIAVRALLKRLDSLDAAVEKATAEISRLGNFCTREEVTEKLGNMGNRFDERHSKVREDIGAVHVRLARLEERSTAPTRTRK